jgi:hypothetical protein
MARSTTSPSTTSKTAGPKMSLSKASRSKAPAPPPVTLVPAASSFDFLEGRFAATQKSRLLGVAVIGTSSLLLAGTLLVGSLAYLGTHSVDTQAAAAAATSAARQATLSQIDTSGGFSAQALQSQITPRQQALSAALSGETDVVRLVSAIEDGAPTGVTISSITFAAPAAATNVAPVDAATSPATPAGPAVVTIVGTVDSFALIGGWATQVGTINGLTAVNPTWTGGGTAIATTLTANITTAGLTARSLALADAATAAPAASPATTPATTTSTGGAG